MKAPVVVSLHATGGRVAVVTRDAVRLTTPFAVVEGSSLIEGLIDALRRLREQDTPVRDVVLVLAPSLMPTRLVAEASTSSTERRKQRQDLFLQSIDPLFAETPPRDGHLLIAMIERRLVRELLAAVDAVQLKLRAIIPAALAIASIAGEASVSFHDGRTHVHVERGAGWPRVRRGTRELSDDGATRIEIDDAVASTWCDVAGAVLAWRGGHGVITPALIDAKSGAARYLHLVIPGLVVMFALASPLVVHAARVRGYEAQLAARQVGMRARARSTDRDARALDELRTISVFVAAPPLLLRLSQLARALPSDVHAIAMDVDTLRLQVVVRGRDVGRATELLASTVGCEGARIVGSISSDAPADSGGAVLQRATVECPLLSPARSSRRGNVHG